MLSTRTDYLVTKKSMSACQLTVNCYLVCSVSFIHVQEKGKYEVIVGTLKAADDMIEFYRDVVTRYPSVVMLVDPIRKEDREQWLPLCEAVTEKFVFMFML